MNLIAHLVLAGVVGWASLAVAQPAEPPKVSFPVLGQIAPRSAAQIESSNWSIGGETLDRDYAFYPNYKQYLGPLGAKTLRVQCGWAKCEKQKGVYDFSWLDEVVNDAIAQGVQPWLQTSYGNPLYPNGGGPGLGDGIPTSDEALAAWDHWVRALVGRYKDRVREWEVWNEPDISRTITPEAFAEFFIRTAQTIRAEQPDAKIYALGLAGKSPYLEAFMQRVREKGRLELIDAVTVHGYPSNPDNTDTVDQCRQIVARYSSKIQIRQGETGAPSTAATFGALRGHPWTESMQAKWDARRMLAHYAKGVPFNLFTLMELHYQSKDGVKVNTKGLLKSKADKTVDRPKPAYFAAQHIFAIFDDSLAHVPEYPAQSAVSDKLVVHGYAKRDSQKQIVTLWLGGGLPSDQGEPTRIDLTLAKAQFDEPVYVDLLSGTVYQIPTATYTRQDNGAMVFKQIPVFDWPTAIAEKSLIELRDRQP